MSDPFLAQITLFASNFAPRNWALCDGQLLPIANYQALFSLLGTTYGGDGRTTFALPDMRGRAPIHRGSSGAGNADHVLGGRGGATESFLNATQIPAHTHTASVSAQLRAHGAADADANVPGPDRVLGKLETPIAVQLYSDSETGLVDFPIAAPSVGNTGGGQSHENQQPYLALNYIIAINGIFPSRS